LRVTLIHNPTAGPKSPDAQALVTDLRRAGHEVRYQSRKARNFPHVLSEPADVIAVAGGDGTVAKVAERVPRGAPPLAVIPLGNANNIAASLGIQGRIEEIVAQWKRASHRELNCWDAVGPWGRRFILEGVGIGGIADIIVKLRARHRKSTVLEACATLSKQLKKNGTRRVSLQTDHGTVTGEFAILEVLNFGFIGPRLRLAPEADPFDGCLDVVCVGKDQRRAFVDWLESQGAGPPPVSHHRSASVSLTWEDGPIHLGDKIWCGETKGGQWTAEIRHTHGVDVLVP
jgi:diacylglycerol kinase (ATP)